jgi:hypothetical protein
MMMLNRYTIARRSALYFTMAIISDTNRKTGSAGDFEQ